MCQELDLQLLGSFKDIVMINSQRIWTQIMKSTNMSRLLIEGEVPHKAFIKGSHKVEHWHKDRHIDI